MSQFQTQEFKNQQTQWYKKLKESSFKDIEDHKGRFIDHKSIADLNQRVYFINESVRNLTLDYFLWASTMVCVGIFKCMRDKIAWEYHSEGLTGTQIAKLMGYKNRKWINRVLKKVRYYLKLASI